MLRQMQKMIRIMMNEENKITAKAENGDIGKRADVFVSRVCGGSRSAAQALLEKGDTRFDEIEIEYLAEDIIEFEDSDF